MKLTKIKIEELAREIIEFLKKHKLNDDACIYFNNKRIILGHNWDREKNEFISYEKTEENICPLDYFEYANTNHILSMSFEGSFYDVMNGYNSYTWSLQEKFGEILKKYGVYYELGNAWNLSCYPSSIEYEDIEYTPYETEPDPERIYLHKEDVLPELKNIMITWYLLSKNVGDIGSCVLGAGFKFKYKDKLYFMSSCSPYQGSISWETPKDNIKQMLETIGATEIYYDWGRMD